MGEFGQMGGPRWVRLEDGRVVAAGGDVLPSRNIVANAQHSGSSARGALGGDIRPAEIDICVAPKT